MHFLDVDRACAILRLKGGNATGLSLLEQVRPMLEHVPNIILDMKGIQITSMTIGELANLARAFHAYWENHPHSIAITNLDATGRQSLAMVRFDKLVSVIDDPQDCLALLFGAVPETRVAP